MGMMNGLKMTLAALMIGGTLATLSGCTSIYGAARDERSMGQIRGRGAVHAEVEASGTIAVILWDEALRPPKGLSSYSQAIGTNVVQQNNFSLQRN